MDDRPQPTNATRPARRPRHLLDLENPQPRRQDPMSLSQVQRWVLSTLVVFTIFHFAAGLVVAAMTVDESRLDGQIVLLAAAGLAGVASLVAARAIHNKPVVSPWLALGLLPAVVGAFLVFA